MADPLLGALGLALFFGVLIASLRGLIPQNVLPIQSALVLVVFVLLILAFLSGEAVRFSQLMSNVFLHPITALLGGFLVTGAIEASGGFKAAIRILERLSKTPLGLPGTVAILINMAVILPMPCGRIIGAALMPAAIMFGIHLAKEKRNPLLASAIVFGFIVNAAASCGPSPLGGIGMVGEGLGGLELGKLSNPQQIAIMLITATTLLVVRFVYRIEVSEEMISAPTSEASGEVPLGSYVALSLFFFTIAGVLLLKPPVPIQTILVFLTVAIMLIGRVTLNDLAAGVCLHPVMAIFSGFLIASTLILLGGFDVLISCLKFLVTHTPLGYVGVAVLVANLPTILPMPCGRIIAMAMVPGVLLFGQEMAKLPGINEEVLGVVLTAFIVNAAASCGPSPLGGIGGVGEGNLRTAVGAGTKPQQLGIMIGTGVAAAIVGLIGWV